MWCEFIKELLQGVFWSYQSVASWCGFALFILWILLPKFKWEGKIKQRLGAVSWPYRLLIILVLLFISTICTSYSMYTGQQQTITKLQERQALRRQDTKQEIRTCLESINPEILQRVDAGRKKILVCINTQDVVRLSNLSERVDFDKYLSFRQVTLEDNLNELEDPNIYIEKGEYIWVNNGHYLYPKDALMR